jgi:hypothetical protein
MDHWNILDYEPDARTTRLGLIKRQLVLSEIILKYTFIDECLTVIVCHYYFKGPEGGSAWTKLWKTKKFQIFNHYIMDVIYMLKKLGVVRGIKEVPKAVRDNIGRINALRNVIAHSFFPENRREYAAHGKVLYRDSDIYSVEGIKKFEDDFAVVSEYLFTRTRA